MKKIDKAWEMNSITKQYSIMKSKEEIVEDLCPSNFRMKDSNECFNDNGCIKCWNREIEKEEKYTNFYLAREHMHKGGKCEYEGKIYYIFNGVMYLEFSGKEDKIENRVAYLSLEDIDSLEWLMLDK